MTHTTLAKSSHSAISSAGQNPPPATTTQESTVQQTLRAVVNDAIRRHDKAEAELRARAAAQPLKARIAQD